MTLLAIATALLALLSLRLYLRNRRLVVRYRSARIRLRSARAQLVRSVKRRAALVRIARYCRRLRDDLDIADVVGAELAVGLHEQAARYDAAIEALTARIAELLPRRMTPFEMVRAFHVKFGQIDASAPDISKHRELRVSLITEEFRELRDALNANDVVGVADALADLLYVVVGSGLQWGIPLEAVLAEVHRSNMTKEGGGKRADGKILKGPAYEPPDIASVLAACACCAYLDAFFDEELDTVHADAFRDHLATCERCQRVLDGRMQEQVTASRSRCEDRIAFLDGALSADQAEMFRAHLPDCAACQQSLPGDAALSARLSMLTGES